jgi:hypothetical protein
MTEYLADRLVRIEAGCRSILETSGYPTDPDVVAEDRPWRNLQRQTRNSRTPYDDRALRALAGLLLIRQLREALDAGDADRAARFALDLGPLENDTLTHALAVQTNRERGWGAANRKREAAKQRRRDKVLELADDIQAKRASAGESPLPQPVLAATIRRHPKSTRAIRKLAPRTIRDYLAR